MQQQRTYIAIDLKSFYASVECVDRGLDPLTTNLVVADASRTEKTICLAVSPSLKAYGIGGRARLFEVNQRVREYNLTHPSAPLTFIAAPPRMARYIEVSTQIYETYLKYIAAENVHVYSIDEVFIDATAYLDTYKMTARDLATMMIRDVLKTTGITATAGIGTNLYLAKVAMDIVAKHIPADQDGVRVAELDEMEYRRRLWNHRPLSSFWQIGKGIAERLAPYGIDTMGKIARQSIQDEELLYRLFGIHAELIIDHAWGWEPCTIDHIKQYRPKTTSLSHSQVLSSPYDYTKAKVVLREMADNLALELVEKRLLTSQVTLTVNYDTDNLANLTIRTNYHGPVTLDYYGRAVPKHAHGTENLSFPSSSSRLIIKAFTALYERIVNASLLIRRLTLVAEHIMNENEKGETPFQLNIFEPLQKSDKDKAALDKERRLQEAQLSIKRRYGKNAILKGMNFEDGATSKQRNEQIGGHKA